MHVKPRGAAAVALCAHALRQLRCTPIAQLLRIITCDDHVWHGSVPPAQTRVRKQAAGLWFASSRRLAGVKGQGNAPVPQSHSQPCVKHTSEPGIAAHGVGEPVQAMKGWVPATMT